MPETTLLRVRVQDRITRAPTPAEGVMQLPYLHRTLSPMFPCLEDPGHPGP